MPKRITLLTTGLALGGAETQVVLLARTLKRRGWMVEVVSMLPPVAFCDVLGAHSIPVHSLDMTPGRPTPFALLGLRRRLQAFRPHVLHSHMVHANLMGRLAGWWCRLPVVISTAHSSYEGAGWRDWAYRWTDSLAHLTTNVSQAGVRRYLSRKMSTAAKMIWVPNGLDMRPYLSGMPSGEEIRARLGWGNEFRWIAVGNLREAKDYPTLLRALERTPNSRLSIVGSGELERELRGLADSLGVAPRVEFLGARRDVPELLRAADGYVISSAWEGTPMALLEAAASALPVVATDAGGNREVVDHGSTGFIVPCGDSRALAAAMEDVESMPAETRQRLGDAGRKKVSLVYDLDRVVDRWENIYKQFLAVHADERHASRRPNLFRDRTWGR